MPGVVVVAVMRAKAGSGKRSRQAWRRPRREPARSLAASSTRFTAARTTRRGSSSSSAGPHGALNEHFTKPYIQELGQRAHLLAEPAQVHFLDALPAGDPAKGSLWCSPPVQVGLLRRSPACARRRWSNLVAELRKEVGDRVRGGRAVGAGPVEPLEELGGAQRRPNLPTRARRAFAGHLVRRAGRDLERLAAPVAALGAADDAFACFLEHLEPLGLARMEVLGWQRATATAGYFHLQNLTTGLGCGPDEAQAEAVGP